MGEKVYAVSTGTYSDYRVAAIFSTREKAGAYIAEVEAQEKWADFNPIEEYPLDGQREELPGAWHVMITDAGTLHADPFWSMSYRAALPPKVLNAGPFTERRFEGYGLTEEHARRSAEELRRQTLALEGKVVGPARQTPEGKD